MLTIGYPFHNQEVKVIMEVLINDGTIVFPTETFYAVGCLARSSIAVERIYALKHRDKKAPLLVLIDSWKMLEQYAADVTSSKRNTLKQFWPGALTAVFKQKGNLAQALNLSTKTIGFRMTSSVIARKLVSIVDSPLVGTSANLSAEKSISHFEKTQQVFGDRVDLYIDGGTTPGGLPSTIVDMTDSKNYTILREGSVLFNPIERQQC